MSVKKLCNALPFQDPRQQRTLSLSTDHQPQRKLTLPERLEDHQRQRKLTLPDRLEDHQQQRKFTLPESLEDHQRQKKLITLPVKVEDHQQQMKLTLPERLEDHRKLILPEKLEDHQRQRKLTLPERLEDHQQQRTLTHSALPAIAGPKNPSPLLRTAVHSSHKSHTRQVLNDASSSDSDGVEAQVC